VSLAGTGHSSLEDIGRWADTALSSLNDAYEFLEGIGNTSSALEDIDWAKVQLASIRETVKRIR